MANCWIWDVDPVILPIWGPFQIRWYGLMFLFVFWGGYLLLAWQFRRSGRDEQWASRFINTGVAGILIGAWFGHRFFYDFDRVLENPLYLVDVTKGLAGLSSHGATVGLIAAMIWFARRHQISVSFMIDSNTFGAALSGALVRLGNFFNSEIVGRPLNESWAVCMPRLEQPPIGRHPTQLYESAAGVGLLVILLVVDRMAGGSKRPKWLLTGTYLLIYFITRFVIEYFKAYQTLDQGLTMGQWLSIPGALFGALVLGYSLTRVVRENPPRQIENTP